MKQKISPAAAGVVIAIAALAIIGFFYKVNSNSLPAAPPIPMAIKGGEAVKMGLPPANKEGGTPMPGGPGPGGTGPGGGMGLPGGSGGMAPPGGPPR